jgi:hypothetical protein
MPTTLSPNPMGPGFSIDANGLVTVSAFVRSPTVALRTIGAITEKRLFSDRFFGGGPTPEGGAVAYEEIDGESFLFVNGEPQEILPGKEFPLVEPNAGVPQAARVTKRGLAFHVTDEAVRRNNVSVVTRGIRQTVNTMVRAYDGLAVSLMNAAVAATKTPTYAASAFWSNVSTDIFADIENARYLVEGNDLGLEVDSIILNTIHGPYLRNNTKFRDLLPRENMVESGVHRSSMSGVARIQDWYFTNAVPTNQAWLGVRGEAGKVSNEVPLNTKTIRRDETESWLIKTGRTAVQYIDNPKALVKITGLTA